MIKFEEINILTLSYVGDAVHTLFVREKVVNKINLKAGDYHTICIKFCKASAQAKVLDEIFVELTEEEKNIAKRARNAKGHKAKNASLEDYKKATAFEALVGFLYLSENKNRLNYLLEKSFNLIEGTL